MHSGRIICSARDHGIISVLSQLNCAFLRWQVSLTIKACLREFGNVSLLAANVCREIFRVSL